MQIIELNINELKPYKNNAKIHTDEQIDQIVKSIEEFGMNDPVGIWGEENLIVEGHGRLLALKKMGKDTVPCIRLDHLTEEQRKAYTLAHNKLTMNTDFDFEMLEKELQDIEMDMSDFGFDFDIVEPEVIEDEVPEVDEESEPTAKLGDIWQLGRHRLMCGDSTDKDTVEKLMNGVKADMTFCDPPYGYNYQSNMRTKSKKFDILKNDDKILDFFPLLKLYNKGFVFICASWKNLDEWIALFKTQYELTNLIIWNKGGGGIGDLKKTFSTDYEVILCSHNGCELLGKRIGSVWDIKKDSANDYKHATQKPVKLSVKAIKSVTKNEDIVLDLFSGSGSVLIGCEQINRINYAMELDPKYIDVIIKRWETLTGETAVLIN